MAAMPSSEVNHAAIFSPVRPATSSEPVPTEMPLAPAWGWTSGKPRTAAPEAGVVQVRAVLPRWAIRKSRSVTGISRLLPAGMVSMVTGLFCPAASLAPNFCATGTRALCAPATSPSRSAASASGASRVWAKAPLAMGSVFTRRGEDRASSHVLGVRPVEPPANPTGLVASEGSITLPVRSAPASTVCQAGESGTHRSGSTSSSPSSTSSCAAFISATVAVVTSSAMHCPSSSSDATASSTRSAMAGATTRETVVVAPAVQSGAAAELSPLPNICTATQPAATIRASTRPMTAQRP